MCSSCTIFGYKYYISPAGTGQQHAESIKEEVICKPEITLKLQN